MKYRVKVFRVNNDSNAHSRVLDTIAQLHAVACALRDAYPTHTMVVQRHVSDGWEDHRVIDETGGFEL